MSSGLPFPGIAAFDLDGTLLRSDHSLSPRTVEALRALHGKGCLPVVSTGRSYEGVEGILKTLELDIPVICYNGAMIVYGKGKVLRHWKLPEEPLRQVLEMARQRKIHFQGFHGKEVFAEQSGPPTDYYLKATGLVTEITRFDQWDKLDMTKVILIGPYNRESRQWPELHQMQQILKERFGNIFYTAFSKPFYLELINGECSKGKSLQWLMESFDVEKVKTAAFGDGLNDAEMLQAAGISVAMANSNPALFDFCSHRTESNDAEGVASFIEKNWL